MIRSMSKFQILAIDGGGMRGLFPSGILARFEETFGCRIADSFDLIVGTSTGGIIALGLGKGLSPAEIEAFYLEKGLRIFDGADSVLRGLAQLAENKFDSGPLMKELQDCFGDTLLGESQKRLVVTSYDMENDDVRLIKTAHHPRLRNDFKLPMWQVALATSDCPDLLLGLQGNQECATCGWRRLGQQSDHGRADRGSFAPRDAALRHPHSEHRHKLGT